MGRNPHDPPPTLRKIATSAAQVPVSKQFEDADMSEEAIAHRQHIYNNAVGPSPKTTCVVNGIKLRALADSGSEVTTITKSCYLQHFDSLVEDTTYWLHLGAANYEGIAYVGYTELDVEVDHQTIHKAGILIQEDPTDPDKLKQKREVPMTLGCNIMNKLIQAKLQEPLKSYVELTHHSFTASNNKINVILDMKKPEKKQAYAKTDRKLPVVIPACTEMTVRTTTTKTKYPFEALVESNPRGLPAGLIFSFFSDSRRWTGVCTGKQLH